MKIRVISMAKVKQSFILDGEAEFIKRLPRDWKVEREELTPVSNPNMPISEQISREAKALLAKVQGEALLVALDQKGKNFSSEELAAWMQSKMNAGHSQMVFAIGGPHGWHESVLSRANVILSLSPLTFTFQMARLILIEQIYRAWSILSGTSYHK